MSSGRDEMLANVVEDEQLDFMGRPTKFKPEYCKKVIELGKLGKSFEQMAAQMDVGYRTLCRWRETHEDFCHALDEAQALAQNWWEEQAQAYMVENKESDKLNASLWSRSMAARFPKKYRESTKTEITGENGAPLLTSIQVSFVKPENRSDDAG